MSTHVVSGEVDVLASVARAMARLDEAILGSSGDVEAALSRFARGTDLVQIGDRGAQVESLGRRWSASTQAMAAQGAAFVAADGSSGPVTASERGEQAEQAEQNMRESREMSVLTTLFNRFEEFDTARQNDASKADNRVSRADLEAAARRNDEVGAAARWILDQPDLLGFLDTGSANIDYLDKVEEGRFYSQGGDGEISVEDVVAYVEKREVNRILREVSAKIDVAAQGGAADGVLSRADYEAFVRSGNATDVQVLAITVALQQGAVDGEQGVASDVADAAAIIADASGQASAILAFSAVVMASTGVLAPAAAMTATAAGALGTVSLAASTIEGAAGLVAGEDDHIVSAGIGLVTFGAGRGASVVIRGATTPAARVVGGSSDEVVKGMLESTPSGLIFAEAAESAVGSAGDATSEAIAENRTDEKVSLGVWP